MIVPVDGTPFLPVLSPRRRPGGGASRRQCDHSSAARGSNAPAPRGSAAVVLGPHLRPRFRLYPGPAEPYPPLNAKNCPSYRKRLAPMAGRTRRSFPARARTAGETPDGFRGPAYPSVPGAGRAAIATIAMAPPISIFLALAHPPCQLRPMHAGRRGRRICGPGSPFASTTRSAIRSVYGIAGRSVSPRSARTCSVVYLRARCLHVAGGSGRPEERAYCCGAWPVLGRWARLGVWLVP